jgi:hypothetical protein
MKCGRPILCLTPKINKIKIIIETVGGVQSSSFTIQHPTILIFIG